MAPLRPFATLRRLVRARDVFGKPVRSDGVTVVPVASVLGGGGAGTSERARPSAAAGAANPGQGQADGGVGFGLWARPVGAFVIRDGKVRWRPAVDVTSLMLAAAVGGVVIARRMLRDR